MKECDSRGELGDMGVVAGGGAESQDQEVRAQRYRRELGEEERRHRRGTCVIYINEIYPFCQVAAHRALQLLNWHRHDGARRRAARPVPGCVRPVPEDPEP